MSKDLYVVAYEGDDPSVLNFAIERAKRNGAALHIVHVLEWSPYSFLTPDELAERHKRKKQEVERAEGAILKPAQALASNAGVEEVSGELRYGNVVDLICEIAKEKNAEMIFVGRAGSGESGFGSRVFGSVTIGLAQVAPVPTVIVP